MSDLITRLEEAAAAQPVLLTMPPQSTALAMLLREAAEALLDLIQSERAGSPIGQNDQPGLAFSDAGEP